MNLLRSVIQIVRELEEDEEIILIREAAAKSFNKKAFNEPPLRFSVKSLSLLPVDVSKVDELIHSSSEDVKKTEELYLNKFETLQRRTGKGLRMFQPS